MTFSGISPFALHLDLGWGPLLVHTMQLCTNLHGEKVHLEPSGLLKSLQTFIGRGANGNSRGWETPGTGPIEDNEMVWQACKAQTADQRTPLPRLDIAPLHGYRCSKLNKTCSCEPSLPDTGYAKLSSAWTNKVLCHSHLSAKYIHATPNPTHRSHDCTSQSHHKLWEFVRVYSGQCTHHSWKNTETKPIDLSLEPCVSWEIKPEAFLPTTFNTTPFSCQPWLWQQFIHFNKLQVDHTLHQFCPKKQQTFSHCM